MDLRALLGAVEDAAPIEAVDVLAAELAKEVGAEHVGLVIANFSGTAVVRLSHVSAGPEWHEGRNERTEALPLPSSVHEKVLYSQQAAAVEEGDTWLVLVPVTERGDAIGLLELSLPARPDEETLDYLADAAHALAYTLVASRRHTDLFEWAQRDIPFSVPAEIQRRLLPSAYTVEGGAFTLSGWLEPCHNVGGDTFDYSIDREHLYVSITDGMGHSTDAALVATLTVGTLRNARRALATPAEQADAANAQLTDHAGGEQFVTGLLVRIRLADDHTEIVNAGHHIPTWFAAASPWLCTSKPSCPSASAPTPTTHRACSFNPVTGSFWSPTATSNATPPESTSTPSSRAPSNAVLARSSRNWPATSWIPRAEGCATTPPPCAWTGTDPTGMRDGTAGASRARTTPN